MTRGSVISDSSTASVQDPPRVCMHAHQLLSQASLTSHLAESAQDGGAAWVSAGSLSVTGGSSIERSFAAGSQVIEAAHLSLIYNG